MTSIGLVSYADLIDSPLIAEYASECSIPEIGEANPQPHLYGAMEQAGMMQCFAALRDGNLAGFACALTPVLPHYGKRVATLESLFVSLGHRRYGVGRELMLAVERHAVETRCVGVLYSAPAGGRLEKLLEVSRKYRRTNAVFYRSLL